ncbi:Scarecrow-like protein 32 [Platanthera guangdongensis]|uniref:Scarecrow-like protein 32 n=1 Tax=Platanthera guangdongensis TaxID=2320717 RepID=A0ABR2MDG2_9ASPA
MMQFTENAPPPSLYTAGGGGASLVRPWPDFPTSAKSLQGNFNNAACMEQLLVHCACAIEANDATLAQQILWVLHNIAPPEGDSNQRLTSAFLRALVLRASRSGCAALASSITGCAAPDHPLPLCLSPLSLAGFIDLTPWHRFGFSAANSAIADAAEGFSVLHLVDLTTTHCMQLPTLIDCLASRYPDGPPFLRLTLPTSSPAPPTLDISLHELGTRLVNFARSRNIGMEFHVVASTPSDGFDSLLRHLRAHHLAGEALVINCHLMPHRIPDESAGSTTTASRTSPRSAFTKALRSLEPALVIVVDEEADFTAGDVVGRIKAAFNYMWIPFDAAETFLPAGCEQRRKYEAAVCWKIENVIAMEGVGRVERLEPKAKWVHRMRAAGFAGIGFGEEAVAEVRGMLDEHSAGWGLKRDDDDLMLTWKGHDVVFASAWVPTTSAPV